MYWVQRDKKIFCPNRKEVVYPKGNVGIYIHAWSPKTTGCETGGTW